MSYHEKRAHLQMSHGRAVAVISERIKQFYTTRTPYRVYHGSTNSTRKSQHHHDRIIDISGLNNVLDIDVEGMTALVEPNVPMDKLVEETLKFGLIPPVVMEFPGITVGGGFAGTSGESSSFRHGLFDRTVKNIQIVLGNGDVLVASETDRSDLFWGAASSCGTVGVVTMLVLELVSAKQYVALTYIKVDSVEEAIRNFKKHSQDPGVDYMDGILFARDRGVVCFGRLSNDVPDRGNLKQFSRPTDDWFYINAESRSTQEVTWTEHIPIRDYLFRYERGAFWISKYTYQYFAVPLNRFTRWMLDSYTHTRVMYNALHHSGLSNRYIIQDVAVPYEKSAEMVNYLEANFQNYPLWLCPLKLRGKSPQSAYGLTAGMSLMQQKPEMVLNFGVWGPGHKKTADFVAWNKAFESKIREVGGEKWLYAHTYYTEQQFWEVYDKEQHDAVRKKYHAEYLPSLYNKVAVKDIEDQSANFWVRLYALFWSIWPLAGLYGWLQCMLTDEYLLPKRKAWQRHRRAVKA